MTYEYARIQKCYTTHRTPLILMESLEKVDPGVDSDLIQIGRHVPWGYEWHVLPRRQS